MKKMSKDILSMTGAGMMMGVGSMAIGSLGGSAAGLTAISAQMPAIGSLVGLGTIVRQTKKLGKIKLK